MNVTEYAKANGNEWTPRSGQTRYYLNNAMTEFGGLQVTRYGTGNVSSATFRGEPYSNGRATRLLALKVWVGAEDGLVHVEDRESTYPGHEAYITAAIEAKIAASA